MAAKVPAGPAYVGAVTLASSAANLDRAVAWYQDVLGFTLLYRVDEIGWCELSTCVPGVNYGISLVDKPKAASGIVPTWGVADIDAARTALEAKGVRFAGPTVTYPGMVRLATFFDPDGNAHMFFQSLAAKD